MAIHQLIDGRWYIEYRIKGTTKKTREYFGRGIPGETLARERWSELEVGSYNINRTPKPTEPTFGALAKEYMSAKEPKIAKSSFDAMTYKLSGVILPELGNLPSSKLTHHRLDQYVKKRLSAPLMVWYGPILNRKQKPIKDGLGRIKTVSSSTVHREVTDVIAILNWGVRRKYIARNPLHGYEKPTRNDEIIPPPTITETMAILAHADAHVIRAMSISYYTGLRPGASELLNIKWSAVDFDARTILIISAKKGGPRARLVPIHEDFYDLLMQWQDEDRDKTAPEIITYRGKPVKRIIKGFNAAKRRAGISRRLRPYDFRHAFVTALLMDDADPKTAAELAGHSRVDTTLRTYNHVTAEKHRRAIEKLPKLQVKNGQKSP